MDLIEEFLVILGGEALLDSIRELSEEEVLEAWDACDPAEFRNYLKQLTRQSSSPSDRDPDELFEDALRESLAEELEIPLAEATNSVILDSVSEHLTNEMVLIIKEHSRRLRPYSEYSPEMGPVVWWSFPVMDLPFIGMPDEDDFPEQYEDTGFFQLIDIPVLPETIH